MLDEESCKLVSEYLRENTQFTVLEIKGCNITPTGFAKLCEGIKNNVRMNTITAEWNKIGSNQKGLNALLNLVEENSSI